VNSVPVVIPAEPWAGEKRDGDHECSCHDGLKCAEGLNG
jgi:hypothetical protein